MNTFAAYFKERFPVTQVLLFAFGYAILAFGITASDNPAILLTLGGIFTFFLLRQRVTDEFKDAAHDKEKYPNRPVPQGLISRRQLIALGLFALLGELLLVASLGGTALAYYSIVFIYSLLMAKEFFVSDWLEKHFTTYFLSHEAIFIFFGLFFLSTLWMATPQSNQTWILALAVLAAAPMSVEVIRKFKPRYDSEGREVPDTYSTVWGRNNALGVLIGLSIFTGVALSILIGSVFFVGLSVFMMVLWLTLGRKSDKATFLIGVFNFLGFAFACNFVGGG